MLTSSLTSWTLLRSPQWASKVSWRKRRRNIYRAYPGMHKRVKWVGQLSEGQHHLTTSWAATTAKSTRLSRARYLYTINRVPSSKQVRAIARLATLKQRGISSNQVKMTYLLIKVSSYWPKQKQMKYATRQGRTLIIPARTKMSFTIFWGRITNHTLIAS